MHFMNPQRRAHMAAPGAPAAAMATPGAEGEVAPELTITLTKSADGTITCDAGDGNPQPYATVDEALDAAKMILEGGEGEEEPGGEALRPVSFDTVTEGLIISLYHLESSGRKISGIRISQPQYEELEREASHPVNVQGTLVELTSTAG